MPLRTPATLEDDRPASLADPLHALNGVETRLHQALEAARRDSDALLVVLQQVRAACDHHRVQVLAKQRPVLAETRAIVSDGPVEVRCRFTDNLWAGGFDVNAGCTDADALHCRLRRRSDRYLLPVLFEAAAVREALSSFSASNPLSAAFCSFAPCRGA